MSSMDMDVAGEDDLQRNFTDIQQQILDAVQSFMEDEAQALMADSQALAPVDTGMMEASANWDSAVGEDYVEIAVGYSAIAPDGYPYPIRQHEDLTYHHTVGEAKFLETPTNVHGGDLEARLGDALGGLLQ